MHGGKGRLESLMWIEDNCTSVSRVVQFPFLRRGEVKGVRDADERENDDFVHGIDVMVLGIGR
jgi:hypothetical protein